MSRMKLLKQFYIYLSILVFNVLIVVLLVNLFFAALLNLGGNSARAKAPASGRFAFTEYSEELKDLYPGLKPEEVTALIRETGSIPLGYRPFIQFGEKPFVGKHVNVEKFGFRPVANQAPWPPDETKKSIFVFGGSTTFGSGVTDYETIASWLSKRLEEMNVNGVQVYNFGRGNYIFGQEVVLLQQLLLQNHVPTLAIFIDGLNDLNHVSGNPAFTKKFTQVMDEGEISTSWKLFLELPISRFFFSGGKNAEANSPEDSNTTSDKVIDRYLSNKKLASGIAQHYGFKTLFVWQPVPVYKYDQKFNIFRDFDYSRFLPYLKPGYEIMATRCLRGRCGDDFLWLADMQENFNEPLYVDAVHYSSEMSKNIASKIAETIIDKGLLK